MRVRLKKVAKSVRRLADGTVKTYYYAWRGGPRLPDDPESPEFLAAYHAAVTAPKIGAVGTIQHIMDLYERSPDFANLSASTKKDYRRHFKAIEIDYGTFPTSAFRDRRTRGEFLAWRDRLSIASPRTADYRLAVLARIFSWARDRGHIDINPIERPGRLYSGSRSEKVWSEADETAFMAAAGSHLTLALVLALWTGQRQGDLLRLTWSQYDGRTIRLRQKKTGAHVAIPVGKPLREALDAARLSTKAVTILATTNGTSWTSDGFRASWRKACEKAKVVDLTFHDLRGTAVTRLAVAGCTVPEIASITGHSLQDVSAILDSHYLKRDPALAESAIKKLEKRTKLQNELQNADSESVEVTKVS
jgi:integrase